MKKISVCVLSVFLWTSCAFAAEVGKVTYVDGRVDLLKTGSELAVPIREGEVIAVGDSIRTKSDSKAEIAFKDNSVVRMAQNSRVEVKDYVLDKDNKRKTATIKLDRGKARTIIAKMPDAAEFNIVTPNAEGKVKGSDIFTFYQAGSSGMLVADGRMELKNIAHPDASLLVSAGNSALVNFDESPKGARPYMDLEKKMYEQETLIPPSARKLGETSVIHGAVVNLSGKVMITKGAAAARPVNLSDIIGEGDYIETGDSGLIEIKFDNGCGLSLKPNTQIRITRLVIDPKTGEYQNLFESSQGKIKARIENLKGRSSFEVKTPAAICGARGTFMYLDITPTMAKAFFEGGNGYIKNLISGAETSIGMGYNGSTDNQGHTSNPAPTSNEERDNWTQGWNTDNGTSGYSSGGSNDSLGNVGDNSGGNNNINNANDNNGTNDKNGNPDVYIPPEGTNSNPTPPPPQISIEPKYFDATNNEVNFEGMDWTGNDYVPCSVNGLFSNPDNLNMWRGDFSKTIEGGKILGFMGGTDLGNSLRGLLLAMYIKDGDGYYETGWINSEDGFDLIGEFHPETGDYSAEGRIIANPQGATTIAPEDLYFGSPYIRSSSIAGKIAGDLSGMMYGESFQLIDASIPQNWQLWRTELSGTYSQPPSSVWSAVVGGSDEWHDQWQDGVNYWIVKLNSSDTELVDGQLRGKADGTILEYYYTGNFADSKMGSISGDVIGIYNAGAWQALACGVNIDTELQFGALLGGTFGHYDPTLNYDTAPTRMVWDNSTDITAVLGGTESLWSTAPQVTIMGGFTNQAGHKLWTTDLYGRTSDGAALLGVAGGTALDNSLKGLLYAFYIRPIGDGQYRAGYIRSSDISGDFYPGIGMFEAAGNLSLNDYLDGEMPTTVKPEELYDGSDKMQYNGASIGKISGPGFSGSVEAESANIIDQSWSLWRAACGGSYSTVPTGTWEARMGGMSIDENAVIGENDHPIDSYWLGTVFGEDGWQNLSIEIISLGGNHIGIAVGQGTGAYDPASNTWEALNIGFSTDETPLTSSGRFVAQGWNLPEGSNFDFHGLIGLIGPIWGENNPTFISMGEFTPPDSANPDKQFVWAVQKEWYYPGGALAGEDGFVSRYYGYNPSKPGGAYFYTTYSNDGSGVGDGVGSFYGLAAGVGGAGKLNGKIYSLYIAPAGETGSEAGVLYGDISGDYFADIGIYLLSGELTKNLHAENIGILPEDLRSSIRWDILTGTDDHGSFYLGEAEYGDIYAESFSGTTMNIASQNWGVWNLEISGSYTGRPSGAADWQVYDLTGMTSPSDTNYVCGSWLGGIRMSDTSDGANNLNGNIDAIWIELRKDGVLSGRTVTGAATGNYIEVDEGAGAGTWQAGAAGEWVEAAALLATTDPATNQENLKNFSNLITENEKFISIPITTLTGSGSFAAGGIINGTMNLNLYTMNPAMANGIWAALFSGNYSGNTGNSWTLNLANSNANAILTGTQWSDGKWQATVKGNATVGEAATTFTGQAAGTYAGETSGTFSGAGTGTLSKG
jgi:hypothetical protein